MSDIDSTINDIRQKIRVEQKMHEAAKQLRTQLKNRNALEECDTNLMESEKRIDFLEQQLQRMQLKKQSRNPPGSESSSVTSETLAGGSDLGLSSGAPSRRSRGSSFSNLDLRKSDSALSTQKVSLKLHEIAFKLDVERKLKEGTDRITNIYRMESNRGDKRKTAHANAAGSALNETNDKIMILERALKKYQSLYVQGLDDEDDISTSGDISANVYRLAPGIRRPMTGKLKLKIISASHLTHAPNRLFRPVETYAVVKIDGAVKCSTRPNRNAKWFEEFELLVHKGSELEISLYDRVDRNVLVGMWWVKFSDLYEDVRKQQVRNNTGGQAWASATQLEGGESSATGEATGGLAVGHGTQGSSPSVGQIFRAYNGGGIQCLWDVEPIGQLELWLDFVKEAKPQRQPTRLGRKAAVRKRKGDPVVVQGHRFFPKPFYTIMKCAMCEEFLVNSVGFQCEDCNLFCHEKCHNKVVTKCITKSDAEINREEEKINHRIHHRFIPATNLSASWCSHCGYMLALGKRDNRRCTECNMLCHESCSLLVPDFCGMKMSVANQFLTEMKRHSMALPPTSSPTSPSKQPYSMQGPSGYAKALPQPQGAPPQPGQPPFPGHNFQQPGAPGYNHPSQQFSGMSGQQQGQPPPPMQPHMSIPPGSMGRQSIMPPPNKPMSAQVLRKVGLNDFNLKAVLGKGNFGKVMLAEEKSTKELYAIKVLKKEFIVQNDEFESMRSEKRVFQVANIERHPFLIGLHSCFQSDTRLYFVMEYISGGDLMWHIQRQNFSERRAKFYAAEVLLALEYFHRNNIVYRDLKLDNILLAADGHVKVVDYGLCKENMGYGAATNTFCGTPEFMAPEILLEQRYGRAVDWWAFGVLIYEMLLGQPPFRGDTEDEIFDSILDEEVLYPINMSRDSVSILQRLLTREPAKRLGSGPGDAEEIKRHPFFKSINWDDILYKRVTPPYIPQVKSRLDISNFDEEFTRERPVLTPTSTVLDSVDQEEFQSFSYVAEWAAGSNPQWN
ncbi:kinase-like domain-containing protein [Dimargaris cristalligena]|uniref:protein kinase C n=1 Tax=Dimargaris cristalligena TaxID=215637 RepID=A0A4Q0A4S2_9FUNG|nr:kinase-like domain-containing protein [Dimargaris cristalligena]|eukprot:RKP40250.1 kinase-like domain-containing protein [Dimargaris cristalligena]